MRLDDRALKAAMKKMGIQSQDIPCKEVIIKTGNKEIVIQNPQVTKVNMMGQDTFQIMGNAIEREAETSTEDIMTVMEQTGKSEKEAAKALKETGGDLASAIIKLTEGK
ncbi:nascent polypeptide-associated complex protein [Candidatus Woesearchaeota archaeon]|nr:nascent polypeptide-associated complex protein [Candidatus Woesearchaeota archaeon]